MFWGFLIVVGLAVMLFKLGSMSVWMTVLSNALLVALFALACVAAAVLWRFIRRKTQS